MNTSTLKSLFDTYFVDVLKNHYIDAEGTANRPQYWYFQLFAFISLFIVSLIFTTIGLDIVVYLCALALLAPSLCLGIRRLHDLGQSGWLILASFIPVLNLALLVYFCFPGKTSSNSDIRKKAA